MFKKPKRNFRIRGVGENEDCENEELDVERSFNNPDKCEKKKTKTVKKHQPILSFHEDWNEGLWF